MPIYSYDCRFCKKTTEEFHKISRIPKRIRCQCGHVARKVLSERGAVITDGSPKWLESAKLTLPDSAKHIETRSDWRRFLKARHLECIG
jgi:putative FmdB family regulatory protein